MTEILSNNIISCSVENSYRSDHSPIRLKLKFNDFKKGKGLWKLNNSLLYDKTYIDEINKKINEIIIQYAVPLYNFENIDSIPKDSIQLTISDQLFLETLLMEIRGKSISYASFKKKTNNMLENNLKEEIKELEKNTDNYNIEEIEIKKLELENIRIKKLEGSMIRSRAQWINEGEKPTKYFLGLESRNFTNKIIPR